MGRVAGYTLIEVMIFLAISGVLFASAAVLIQGQQGRTQFSQSMRDIDSKLQQYVTEVSASHFPSAGTCSIKPSPFDPNGRPAVSGVVSPLGANEDCIFLGEALQFHHDNSPNVDDTITAYSILGRRTKDGVTLVSSFADANPTPIINGVGGSTMDLVDSYTLPFGAKITSAKDNSGHDSAMAGFYVDLSQTTSDAAANKSASLVSYQYPSNVNISTGVKSQAVIGCLTLTRVPNCTGLNATTNLPSPFGIGSNWLLCFKSATSNQTAQITVNSGAVGIQTKVDFVRCT